MKAPTRRTRVALNTTAVLVFVVTIFPVYWMVATALKPGKDIARETPKFFPAPMTLEHFRTAIGKDRFWHTSPRTA
jgi:N,N'-diacetylchitobiose transport system permease protein